MLLGAKRIWRRDVAQWWKHAHAEHERAALQHCRVGDLHGTLRTAQLPSDVPPAPPPPPPACPLGGVPPAPPPPASLGTPASFAGSLPPFVVPAAGSATLPDAPLAALRAPPAAPAFALPCATPACAPEPPPVESPVGPTETALHALTPNTATEARTARNSFIVRSNGRARPFLAAFLRLTQRPRPNQEIGSGPAYRARGRST